MNIVMDNGKTDDNGAPSVLAGLTTNAHVLNFSSDGKVAASNPNAVTIANTNDDVHKVTIDGDQAFSLTLGTADMVRIVDGSGATGALTLNLANNVPGVVAAKTNTFTYTGGSKGDAVTFGTTNNDTQTETWVINKGASLVNSHDAITNFILGVDKIDVSAFGIADFASKVVTTTAAKLGEASNATAAGGVSAEISVTTAADFFKDSKVVTQTENTGAYKYTAVFIDGDGNGNWNADADQVVVLMGVDAATHAEVASGALSLTA